ncbi:MAG: Endopygalactorunase [Bacteroidota bacterium]|nr:Endopygalactorunase [Bacteroidota bacterium]
MYKIFLLAVLFTSKIDAQKSDPKSALEIIPSGDAKNIGGIIKDTLLLITGHTYSFTVDTPEDSGLVSTQILTEQLPGQLTSKDGSLQQYTVKDKNGSLKTSGKIFTGDHLIVSSPNGKLSRDYFIQLRPMAQSGHLTLDREQLTANTSRDLILYFTAGQRTPDAIVRIFLPRGINVTLENTTVNVIGRGDVKLKDLATQSMGRVGSAYPYHKVGIAEISKSADGGSVLLFRHLDLRPANGPDLKIIISNVSLNKPGFYHFKVNYETSKPEALTSPGIGPETAVLIVTSAISDFERIMNKSLTYKESVSTFTTANFKWSKTTKNVTHILQSLNEGRNWTVSPAAIDRKSSTASVSGLVPGKRYTFRLLVQDGSSKEYSNPVIFYSGKMDIKNFGVSGEDNADNTDKINNAINYLHEIGGGVLFFTKGTYSVRTIHLKTNVWLYLAADATIKAIKGGDAPEATWFSDRKYRSGLSPNDKGPYAEPENWLTKQDVGHHYFQNSMFFGERLDNVKIIGNGRITGNGIIVNGDNVMKNTADNRTDKMFTFKLCTNIEIGGISNGQDLWYDSTKDQPYYLSGGGSKNINTQNMLQIDRSGHFALLATGTDNLNVHDTYFGKASTSNVRDIYDFMSCNNVIVTNIFCKVASDDIVKPGSDCSLGYTRPARHYMIRNIIGDTNCNLFQVGSETADDIMDIHVDNIYVLGANKAGFSISTNDGGHIKDIHLNCGHTGPLHSRSKMFRTYTPFFISISNRGRILGAEAATYSFTDNGEKHKELLVKNINIGEVENVILNGIDISEVYAGSSYGNNDRWKSYNGSQRRATPIIAGYRLPVSENVEGGLDFTLPNGKHTGYIKNVTLNDINVLVKGGNPVSDTSASPPELGVGQYNASNLKLEPSYGIWARHVKDLSVNQSSLNYEKSDGRFAIFFDDVIGARISMVKMAKSGENPNAVKLHNSTAITLDNILYYDDAPGKFTHEK